MLHANIGPDLRSTPQQVTTHQYGSCSVSPHWLHHMPAGEPCRQEAQRPQVDDLQVSDV